MVTATAIRDSIGKSAEKHELLLQYGINLIGGSATYATSLREMKLDGKFSLQDEIALATRMKRLLA